MTERRGSLPPEAYVYYLTRPVQFIQEMVMCLEPADIIANKVDKRMEPQTKEILNAVAANDYVSIFSGRGCTKTTSLAFLALWWIWTRNDSRVIATSPKYDTLKATLWAEIRKWLDRSIINDEVILTGEKIYHSDPKMHSFGMMMTTKEKENISGIHATHVLFLIDEASNVDRQIFDAITGGMNDPEAKIVLTGNPTLASGFFYDTHNKDRKHWKCMRFSSEDSARKSKVWFERMQRYPKNSDIYRVYVDGLPPLGNPKAIISLADCHAAKDRDIEMGNFLEMGVDPAREGDDMATVAIRCGMKLLEVRAFAKTKGPELEGHVLTMLREYRRKTGIKSKVRIKVDDHGLGGPIADYLALNEGDNIEVIPCLFGGAGNDQYADPASIMWFGLADIIEQIELCDDEELIEELSTREWVAVGSGKLKVEAKSVYKERFGKSPDRADSCILCYYTGTRKIFERPDSEGEEVSLSRKFIVDWEYDHLLDPAFDGVFPIDILHYAALVLNKDLSLDGMAAVYQHYVNKLWIYAEFHQDNIEPDVVAYVVNRKTRRGLYNDDRNVRVIGNEDMFAGASDRQSLAEVLLRSKLYVSPSEKYDEFGAIALGMKMFQENGITIHEDLLSVRKTVGLWSIQKAGRPDADRNGYGKALLLILSEVRRRRKEIAAKKSLRDYGPVRKVEERKGSLTGWCRK
jgi:phage terminase large subunit